MRMSRIGGWAFLAALAVATASPGRARACADFYEEARPAPPPKPKPTPEEASAKADIAMLRDDPATAAGALEEGFAKLKSLATRGGDVSWQERKALRTMALALARTDGALGAPGPFYAASAQARAENLQWSIATLRALSAKRANDPILQAELGEALAHVPADADEALRILGGLAAKDVMGSAHAYAQLARLRLLGGDVQGGNLALTRCGLMATTPRACAAARSVVVTGKPSGQSGA